MTSAALIAASLLAGMAATTWQARKARILQVRAESEQATAQRVTDFLIDLFRASEPGRSGGETVTARELLSRGARRLRLDLGDAPEVRATLFHAIGEVYSNLSLYGEASRHSQGRYAAAEALYREGLERASRTLGEDHRLTLVTASQLGALDLERGRSAAAARRLGEVLEGQKAVDGEAHRRTLTTSRHLALAHLAEGRVDAAVALLDAAVATARERADLPPDHQLMGWLLAGLGRALAVSGRLAEAREALSEGRRILLQALGPDHPRSREASRWLASPAAARGAQGQGPQLARTAS